jgi:hypothetical protein
MSTFIGSNEHFALLLPVFLLEVFVLIERWLRKPRHHRVSHRRLRDTSRRRPATGINAPSNAPVAGPHTAPRGVPAPPAALPTHLQPTVVGLEQRRRRDDSSAPPHPAPVCPTATGAGPKPLVADRHPPHGGQGQHRATTAHHTHSPLGGGPARTPAGVTDPRTVAPTGHHKQPVADPPEPTTGPTPTGDPAGGEQGCESAPPTFGPGGATPSNPKINQPLADRQTLAS